MIVTKYIVMMLLGWAFNTYAQPDAASKQVINNVGLYQDAVKKELFYYVPYGMKLITDSDGKPRFKFIQMRYTGTDAYGDQGEVRFRSLLSFSLSQHTPTKRELDLIKDSLKRKGIEIKYLQPLPISNIQATLVHAADTNVADSLQHRISGGFFENNADSKQSVQWQERDFTMRLNNTDAQLFSESFQGNQPTLSINYSYSSKLINTKTEELTVTGGHDFVEAMEGYMPKRDSVPQIEEVIVKSDALPISLDVVQWPDLIKQIDINEQVPSDYAALDVYCFDFNNGIRDDLFAKRIEIKAVGVGGNDVTFTTSFNEKHPDEYAKSIKFRYAVKLKEPYKYKITEIYKDGSFTQNDWVEAKSWHEILDITTKPIEIKK